LGRLLTVPDPKGSRFQIAEEPGVTSTDRDFREALGDATNSAVGAATDLILSARMTARFFRSLANTVPWSRIPISDRLGQ
jgi:hypothetical protein